MRLWSLHPHHLDRAALVACWREALLAQAVLAGRTRGYTRHPQLERFRGAPEPLAAIGAYLAHVATEADARGYAFDRSRIDAAMAVEGLIPLTEGQFGYEWAHLGAKLAARSPQDARRWEADVPVPHPLFTLVPGDIATWERP
jgi:hypothetical protein